MEDTQITLKYLIEVKEAIRDAIISKGIDVTDGDVFRAYADKIKQIFGGVYLNDTIIFRDEHEAAVFLKDAEDIGYYAFYRAFEGAKFKDITLDCPKLTNINGKYALHHAFMKSGIKEINFPVLEHIDGKNALCGAFRKSELAGAVSFPKLVDIKGYQGLQCAFKDCEGVTSASFPLLMDISGFGMSHCFSHSGITGAVAFPKLVYVGQNGLEGCFGGCNATSVSFPLLEAVEKLGMRQAFANNNIKTVTFPKLAAIEEYSMQAAFAGNSNLTDISFPALTRIHEEAFSAPNSETVLGHKDVTTVHFRADMESQVKQVQGFSNNFGCKAVLFDL